MNEVKYAIASLGRPNPNDYSFLSQLAHEYAGKKEVLGYSNLSDALKWDTEEEADRCLEELPEWAHGKHRVIKIENTGLLWRYFWDFRKEFSGFFPQQVTVK